MLNNNFEWTIQTGELKKFLENRQMFKLKDSIFKKINLISPRCVLLTESYYNIIQHQILEDLTINNLSKFITFKNFKFYKFHMMLLFQIEICLHFDPFTTRENTVLENRINKKCRFCNNENPTFTTIAHAIPQFLGNNNILSNFECDNCNNRFSSLESELSQFLSIDLAHIGIINEKTKHGKTFADGNDLKIIGKIDEKGMPFSDYRITDKKNSPHKIDFEKKEIILEPKGQPYVPYSIFKILCKIALTLVKEEEVSTFQYLKQILNNEKIVAKEIIIKKVMVPDENMQYDLNSHIMLVAHKEKKDLYKLILKLRNYAYEFNIPLSEETFLSVTEDNSILLNSPTDQYIKLNKMKSIKQNSRKIVISYKDIVNINANSEECEVFSVK